MAKYSIDGSTLTDIADAIRTQYGEDNPIAVSDMAEAILGISGEGGGGLPDNIELVEFVPTSNSDYYEIENPREGAPRGVFCVSLDVIIARPIWTIFVVARFNVGTGASGWDAVVTSSNTTLNSYNGADVASIGDDVITLKKRPQYQENAKYRTGYKYLCFIFY